MIKSQTIAPTLLPIVGPVWLVKSNNYYEKVKSGQNAIFIEVQPHPLPLQAGTPHKWNFKHFSFIRPVD